MPRKAGTSPCDAHLQQADDIPRWHGVDLSFLLSTLRRTVSEKWLFPKMADPNIEFFAAIEFSVCI
jgi:hypothetical protein